MNSSVDRKLESCVRIPLKVWMSVFVLSYVQVAALRRADHSSKESYLLCKKKISGTEEEARAKQGL
jgi:hypothetical protein